MFGFTSTDATSILTSVTTNGTAIVATLVSLAAVILGVAALKWVLRLIKGAIHL